jgi:very-short-patch-repair endonuclease
MARLWRRFGLPPYEFQHVIRSSDGRFLGRPDFVLMEPKVIIEVNGWASHSSPTATDHDGRRANRLLAHGWLILTFSWNRVRYESADVADEIRTVVWVRLAG